MRSIYSISFILFSVCIADYCYADKTNTSNDTVKEDVLEEDDNSNIEEADKLKGKKVPEKKKTSIIFAGESIPEKTIEVNSVNFIKLKSKANEIFIPDPTIIDVQLLSNNSLYLIGLAPGVTTLVINDKKGKALINCKVNVTYPIKSITKVVKELHPDAAIEIVSIDDSIVLKGKVPSPEAAKEVSDIVNRFIESDKIVNRLKIETSTQVMLKLKIAEVERTLNNSLGLHWRAYSAADGIAGASFGFMSGNTSSGFMTNLADGSSSSGSEAGSSGESGEGSSSGEGASGEAAGAAGATVAAVSDITNTVKTKLMGSGENSPLSLNNGSRWLFHTNGKRGLAGLIDALATENFATVLAEPTLIALSGKTATFKVGGEHGYRTRQDNSDTYTTNFKEWGTEVEFTPIVLSEDRINLTVKPTVSTVITNDLSTEPSLSKKEVETTVELGSGESMAIAGLLQVNKSNSKAENPFLSKIPLLGALFRSSTTMSTEKELVIIITPYIVKPSTKKLKTPIDMVPRMFSPFMSVLTGKVHDVGNKYKRVDAAGFSIR